MSTCDLNEVFPPHEKKISDQGSLHKSCEAVLAAISRSWGERSGDREDSPGYDRQTRPVLWTEGGNAAIDHEDSDAGHGSRIRPRSGQNSAVAWPEKWTRRNTLGSDCMTPNTGRLLEGNL